MIYKPYKYQDRATSAVIKNKSSMLILDMGLGKTVSTATAIEYFMYQTFEIGKTLIIGPKRVVRNVWPLEFKKWDHLKHVKLSIIQGTPAQRLKALKAEADVYLISVDLIAWLVNIYQLSFPFDMLVIDESSCFKDHKSQRFKQLKTVTPQIDRKVALTGTPMPNGFHELWPQYFLLDGGERLGKNITMFRDEFFNERSVKPGSFVKTYKIKNEVGQKGGNVYEQKLLDRVSDITLSMKKEEYLDLPPRINRYIDINLPPEILKRYQEFEEELVTQIDDEDITAANSLALCGKLLQFANGAIYGEGKKVIEIHQEKIITLADIIEENDNANFLVAYWFKHDHDRLCKRFAKLKPLKLDTDNDFKRWNDGKIKMALAHPKSLGHGINLQFGGSHMFWFSNTYSREGYDQLNARLDRQGITKSVTCHHLRCRHTADENALEAIKRKGNAQNYAMQYLKDVRAKYI